MGEMGEIFCFQSKSFQHDICQSWRALQGEKHLCDVTLACNDGQVEAHKVVLSACSLVFKNLIKMHHHNHPLLYLRGVKYSELVHMLNFMYQGEVNISQEELQDFVQVGHDLHIMGLTLENEAQSLFEKVFMSPGGHAQIEPTNSTVNSQDLVQEQGSKKRKKAQPRKTGAGRGRPKKNNPIKQDEVVPQSEPEKENQETTPNKGLLFNHSIYSKNSNFKTETPDNINDIHDEEQPTERKEYIDAAEIVKIENELKNDQARKRTRTYLSEMGMDRAAKEGRFSCVQCDYKTVSSSNLTKHVKAKHLGVKYPCAQCEYQSSNQSNLKKHIKSVHTNTASPMPIGQSPALKQLPEKVD